MPTPRRNAQSSPPIKRTLVGPERQAISEHHPLQADQTQDHQTLHEHRQHVLAANQPAIEERQRRRHQHDQRRTHQQPGGIAGIHGRLHTRRRTALLGCVRTATDHRKDRKTRGDKPCYAPPAQSQIIPIPTRHHFCAFPGWCQSYHGLPVRSPYCECGCQRICWNKVQTMCQSPPQIQNSHKSCLSKTLYTHRTRLRPKVNIQFCRFYDPYLHFC